MHKKFFFFFLMALLLYAPGVWGAMNSASFSIDSDFVGVGGASGASASFSLEDTIAQPAPGQANSASFVINGGFQQVDQNTISVALSSNSLNLGELAVNQVKTVSTVASVTTGAQNGYTLSIGEVSGSSLRPVSGGVVVAGTEAYGIATTGADALVMGDVPVVVGTNLATHNAAVAGSDTTLVFKAAISNNTSSGVYSQNIVLTASANP